MNCILPELGPQGTGERLGKKRLPHPGNVLYKNVPAGKHRHHGQKDTLTLAGNGAPDVPDDAFHPLREIVVVQRNPVYVRWTEGIISYRYQRFRLQRFSVSLGGSSIQHWPERS